MTQHTDSASVEYYNQISTCGIKGCRMPGVELSNSVSRNRHSNHMTNTFQSAYHPCNSTEEALLKVANDLFLSFNKGSISVLALLDFSSAFDAIDHTILVHRLHADFGGTDTVLQWFSSYLTDRTNFVSSLFCFCSRALRCFSRFSSWLYAFHHAY